MLPGILLAAVAAAVAIYFYTTSKAFETQVRSLKSERDTLATDATSAKTELRQVKSSHDEAATRVNELRTDLRKAKEKIHRLSEQAKQPAHAASKKRGGKAQREAVRRQREELAEAHATAENYRVEVLRLERALDDARAAVPAPVAEATPAAAVEGGPRVEDLDAVEREVRREMNERIKATKRESSAKRKELLDEIAGLKKRLNRSLRETDKQRGRADNNEKAYIITKNQLESALDRLHEFDPSVPRPFKLPPEALAKEQAKLEAAEQAAAAEGSEAAESGVVAVEVAEPPTPEEIAAEESAAEESAAEESAPEPEVAAAPEAEPEPEPEPTPEPTPEPEVAAAPEAEPEPTSEPESAKPAAAELPPELPEGAPEPGPETVSAPAEKPEPKKADAEPAKLEPADGDDLWPALDTGPLPSLGSGPLGGNN